MKDYTVEVTENKKIADGLYELTFASTDCGFEGLHCGRFLHMEVPGKLLRRPFCLYKFSETSISVAYAVVGDGTRNMTFLKRGDRLKVTLPLGNGWNLEEKHKKIVLLGGGVGCAPLAYVPVSYPNRKYYAYLGFADKSKVAFEHEFALRSEKVVCTTDNGSYGVKGFPTQALEKDLKEINPDAILVCGPRPMLKATARFSLEHNIPAYASTEERMGCGVGACLVCACAVKQKDSGTVMKRACADGPVFGLEELVL